jgi:hypothetical protein
VQLEPLEEHVLARGLEDHTDSTTYYVRAVVRNAKTDALVGTFNLTDNGNRRFTKTWQVPADPTGQGLWLLVTYTVYTDSGYTTKSEIYGEKFEEHLVLHRQHMGGGGGADIDYKRVRKIVQEELKSLPEPVKPPKVDLVPVIEAIQGLYSEIRAIDMPEVPKTDLEPLQASIDRVERAVKAIEMPETDLSPLLDGLAELKGAFPPHLASVEGKTDALFNRVKQFFEADIQRIEQSVKKLATKLDSMPYVILEEKKQPLAKEEEEINFAELLKQ